MEGLLHRRTWDFWQMLGDQIIFIFTVKGEHWNQKWPSGRFRGPKTTKATKDQHLSGSTVGAD